VPELAAIAEQAGARAVPLADETADMRSTVELGLSRLEELFGPRPNDFWLLVPGDHPSLDASVVRELIDASRRCSDHSIFVPVYQGKRGHPVLLRWHHVSRIRSSPAGVGVNAYFRECGGETMEVPMLSAEILRDLDTPLDYKRFCEAFSRPKPQET
jgi:molybdenum cofactor cytidylyltransferase